jgi:hypothetical protein
MDNIFNLISKKEEILIELEKLKSESYYNIIRFGY